MTIATKCALGCCSVVGASASTVVAVKHLNSSKSHPEETKDLEEEELDSEIPLTKLVPATPVVVSNEPASTTPEMGTEVKSEENQDLKNINNWLQENGGCKIMINRENNKEEELSENTEDLPGLFEAIKKDANQIKSVCNPLQNKGVNDEGRNIYFVREENSWKQDDKE